MNCTFVLDQKLVTLSLSALPIYFAAREMRTPQIPVNPDFRNSDNNPKRRGTCFKSTFVLEFYRTSLSLQLVYHFVRHVAIVEACDVCCLDFFERFDDLCCIHSIPHAVRILFVVACKFSDTAHAMKICEIWICKGKDIIYSRTNILRLLLIDILAFSIVSPQQRIANLNFQAMVQ